MVSIENLKNNIAKTITNQTSIVIVKQELNWKVWISWASHYSGSKSSATFIFIIATNLENSQIVQAPLGLFC